MAQIFQGKTDIMMTLDGDIVLGSNGDFLLTSGFDWLAREVNKVIRTINPEWRDHPFIGANLEVFGGRENSREIGLQIQRQITAALNRVHLLDYGQNLSVRVIPVDIYSVAVVISLDVAETTTVLSKSIFNFTNGTTQEVSDPAAGQLEELDDIHRRPPVNPVRDRLRKRK